MKTKVLLILADGMRPDGMIACGHPFVQKLMQDCSYTMNAQTVMPSVTLPCHMSLFHSVPPTRHNTLTNDYAPMVRPVTGLFEQVDRFEGKTASFYDWEQLRDLSRPGTLHFSYMASAKETTGMHKTLKMTLAEAKRYIPEELPDFAFYYIGLPDEGGHTYGWMSREYIDTVYEAIDAIEQLMAVIPENYRVIITADHGGHERWHGTEEPEDMTIPLFCKGVEFEAGKELENINIMDIAPTVTTLLNIPANREWEGHSII